MSKKDTILFSRLEGIYGVFRKIQATHDSHPDTTEFRCIGSGNCCKIGLVIPLMECENIAKRLREQYWKLAELHGLDWAEDWWEHKIIGELVDAFDDPEWEMHAEDKARRYCAFFDEGSRGCRIYEFRPMVCRAYGTIMTVDTRCPRKRREDGSVVLIRSKQTDATVDAFEKILNEYSAEDESKNYSVFMPMGILKFLLDDARLKELYNNTDKKFWMASPGYPHQMAKREDA